LIETHGADINAQDHQQDTPLHSVLWHFDQNGGGNITVLTYLLSQTNINVNIKNKSGETLLHHACDNINSLPLDVFESLIETHGGDINAQENNDNNTPIHSALLHFDPNDGGDIAVLTYLINQKNVNVNIKGEYDRSLLHLACVNNLSESDSEDDVTDPDDDLDDVVKLNTETDAIFSQVVEVIVERCLVSDDTTSS
jgi:ankyrin repeat protein